MKHRMISAFIIIAICLSFNNGGFAYETTQKLNCMTVSADATLKKLSSKDYDEFVDFGETLANALSETCMQNYDNVIKEICSKNSNTVFIQVHDLIERNNPNNGTLRLKISENVLEMYIQEYEIDENTLLRVTPTYIEVEQLIIDRIEPKAAIETGYVHETSSKEYYNIWGGKIFSLTVECGFYYNGVKAWYADSFDYWYTKGTLSIWQVSNWRGWKESSGTSYKAYCSGNFHWGLEYEGNGLVIQDFYIKNTLSCDKNGHVEKIVTKR